MASDPGNGGSFFSRLETAHKLVALVSAVLAVWVTYLSIRTGQNQAQLNELEQRLESVKQERVWAKELYTSFDQIVSNEAEEQARIDRLAGLLALSQLTEHEDLRKQWVTLISEQARRYAEQRNRETQVEPDTRSEARDQAQLAQYEQLQKAANIAAVQIGPSWSNYDFDVFACPGKANHAIASRVLAQKRVDAQASGSWRLRAISPRSPLVQDKRPFAIVYDFEDELPLARNLVNLMGDKGEFQDQPFRLLRSVEKGTRWYVSVFVCGA
jgi:hypothetical protein